MKTIFKRKFWTLSLGNYYNVETGTKQGRGDIRLENKRYACDPRLRRAAIDCVNSTNLCDFDPKVIQEAMKRVSSTTVNQQDLINKK